MAEGVPPPPSYEDAVNWQQPTQYIPSPPENQLGDKEGPQSTPHTTPRKPQPMQYTQPGLQWGNPPETQPTQYTYPAHYQGFPQEPQPQPGQPTPLLLNAPIYGCGTASASPLLTGVQATQLPGHPHVPPTTPATMSKSSQRRKKIMVGVCLGILILILQLIIVGVFA